MSADAEVTAATSASHAFSTRASSWDLDPAHSSASFTVKHMMISKVHGGFWNMKAQLKLDRVTPANCSVEATIDAASIDTHEPKRDEHLRSADFFDVKTYPNITFKSSRFDAAGADQLRVTGDLTIHGVTKQITLDVEAADTEVKDPYGNLKIGASATVKIKRKEFGLAWNAALETGGFLVGDEVSINLDLQFIKQS